MKQKNFNRRIAGYQAKKKGEEFENILYRQAKFKDFNVIQIPTGCKVLGFRKMMRVKTPFDFVFTKLELDGNVKRRFIIFCDAKTIKSGNFSSSMIEKHQSESLLSLHNQEFKSGYIINFRDKNTTCFFNAYQLLNCRLTPRSSLKASDGLYLGTNIEINLMKIFEVNK